MARVDIRAGINLKFMATSRPAHAGTTAVTIMALAAARGSGSGCTRARRRAATVVTGSLKLAPG
jgi:hypothetical protein